MSDPSARATIHDIGYKRYEGIRRPQNTRWRVLVRNVLSDAWRGWWKAKVWVILAAMVVVTIAAVMYFSRAEMFKQLARAGAPVPYADGLLPISFEYLTKFGFILTMTVCAQIIANDLKTGAFEFYFSRPLRPIDYVVGKLVGAMLVIGLVMFIGPLLLSIFRMAIVEETSQLREQAWVIPKTLAAATIATFTYAAVPLAFSALSNNRRYAIAGWAVYHLVISTIAVAIAANNEGAEAVGALDTSASLLTVIYRIYDIEKTRGYTPPLWAAIGMLVIYFLLGFGIVYWRVRSAQRSGMGG